MQCLVAYQTTRLGYLSNSILYLKTFLFWDICGNIINVTPTKLSSNNNPCFDTSIQGENGTHQIKVMGKSATKQTLFLGKLKSKTLAMLTGLYFPKNSKSKVIFYNHTQWTHHVNVIYVRHSHDARCRTSSDLVILCHLYAFSSAYVFNLYTHLGFVLRLNDIFIHQGVSLGIFCMQCYPSNNQAWLLMKFNFVPQNIFVLRYMWEYYKCHPNKTFKQQQSMFWYKYTGWKWYSSNKSDAKFSNQTNIVSWKAKIKNTSDVDRFILSKKF